MCSPEMSAHDTQNIAFLHDEEVFSIEFDLRPGPFPEENLVSGLQI
jgi:hypothetical protein